MTVEQKKAEKSRKRKYRVSKPTHREQIRSLVEVQMQAITENFGGSAGVDEALDLSLEGSKGHPPSENEDKDLKTKKRKRHHREKDKHRDKDSSSNKKKKKKDKKKKSEKHKKHKKEKRQKEQEKQDQDQDQDLNKK